jgi:hypothetical protein
MWIGEMHDLLAVQRVEDRHAAVHPGGRVIVPVVQWAARRRPEQIGAQADRPLTCLQPGSYR